MVVVSKPKNNKSLGSTWVWWSISCVALVVAASLLSLQQPRELAAGKSESSNNAEHFLSLEAQREASRVPFGSRRQLLATNLIPSTIGEEPSKYVPLDLTSTAWHNDYNLVHVVNTRFMQHQADLIQLGMARVDLFETFTLPSMVQQSNQQFLWLIWTDANLQDPVKSAFLSALKKANMANVVVLAPKKQGHGGDAEESHFNFRSLYGYSWRDVSEENDGATAILYGSVHLLANYYKSAQSHLLLETSLDADDALSQTFVETAQAEAAYSMETNYHEDTTKMQVFCPEYHAEWRYYEPLSETLGFHNSSSNPFGNTNDRKLFEDLLQAPGPAEEDEDTSKSSTWLSVSGSSSSSMSSPASHYDHSVQAGHLVQVHNRNFCIRSGLTVAYHLEAQARRLSPCTEAQEHRDCKEEGERGLGDAMGACNVSTSKVELPGYTRRQLRQSEQDERELTWWIPSGKPPSTGSKPSSEKPSGKPSSGTKPSSEKPSGKPSSGTKPSSEKPSSKPSSGTKPTSEKPSSGTKPTSEKPSSGTKPSSEKPSGKPSSGTKPSSEKPGSGTKPSSEKPSGKPSSGTKPSSEKPGSGTKPSSEKPSGKPSSGTKPSSEKPSSGTKPSSEKPSGKPSSGTKPSSEKPGSGTKPSSEKPSGKPSSGTKPSSEKPGSGTKPSSEKPSGKPSSGTKPSSEKPSGKPSSGTKPSSEKPSGKPGSGSKPSGKPSGKPGSGSKPSVKPSGKPSSPLPWSDKDCKPKYEYPDADIQPLGTSYCTNCEGKMDYKRCEEKQYCPKGSFFCRGKNYETGEYLDKALFGFHDLKNYTTGSTIRFECRPTNCQSDIVFIDVKPMYKMSQWVLKFDVDYYGTKPAHKSKPCDPWNYEKDYKIVMSYVQSYSYYASLWGREVKQYSYFHFPKGNKVGGSHKAETYYAYGLIDFAVCVAPVDPPTKRERNCVKKLRLLPEVSNSTDVNGVDHFQANQGQSSPDVQFKPLQASVLMARTPTAAGMKNVLPKKNSPGEDTEEVDAATAAEIKKKNTEVLPTFGGVNSQEQDMAWDLMAQNFGVSRDDVAALRNRMQPNMESILLDAFTGQCTPGHSCKSSTKKALGYLLNKVHHDQPH
ncbi:hypothetical protein ACA910_001922 [Epithemia clementina (nom. ined.)]